MRGATRYFISSEAGDLVAQVHLRRQRHRHEQPPDPSLAPHRGRYICTALEPEFSTAHNPDARPEDPSVDHRAPSPDRPRRRATGAAVVYAPRLFIVTTENTNLCAFWPEAHSNVSLRHHLNTRHPRLGCDRHV
jgi:hypothetical protein